MTSDQINKAIAEACGWFVGNEKSMGWCESPNGRPSLSVPNFAGSLDAMAEARKTLSTLEQVAYAVVLPQVLGSSKGFADIVQVINATAAQHAEAFLKAKSLWQE